MYEKKPDDVDMDFEEDQPFLTMYEKEYSKAKELEQQGLLEKESAAKNLSQNKNAVQKIDDDLKNHKQPRLDNKQGKYLLGIVWCIIISIIVCPILSFCLAMSLIFVNP